MKLTQKQINNLFDKIEINLNGCWTWTGALDNHGYGRLSINSQKALQAHRVVFSYFNGGLTPGLVCDHMCCNKKCVRPDHIQEITAAENTRLGNRTPRKPVPIKLTTPERHQLKHGHWPEYNKYKNCLICGRIYDNSHRRYKNRSKYRH